MQIVQTARRHPRAAMAIAVTAVALGGLALYWFAPWNLFVDRRVDEAAPAISQPVGGGEVGAGAGMIGGEQGAGDQGGIGAQADPVTVARGGFTSLEHQTAGTALVIELQDGSRFLRLEDLETSNGPDLRVILTDQPVSEDWHVWDDGEHVDLGALKGNLGSSNYEIPDNVDLEGLETAVIWCRRFSVGFGVAPLEPL